MRRVGAEPAATIETTYSGTICTMAAQGTGIGIGIGIQYVANVFAHALRVVPLSPRCGVDVRMAFSGHWSPSTIAEEFAALVAAHFRTLRPVSNA
ncbi:hypothetical protein CTP10_R06350 [Cupriavidus sp. P-10]|uniref:hypothetical protein n=1 Tax=unclassified Cupriavidus TaxID=2640874 RepID=UPI000E2EBD2E|nr:hypothetical protein [Cupriavidus sp. P-10]BDB23306.1 hypothetical protein CTP10_R06350 [Cupriavidus sp. P-10]